MDINAILTIAVGVIIAIIGFFLKRSYDDVRKSIDVLSGIVGTQNGRITTLETQAVERLRVSNEKHDDLEEMIRSNKSELLTQLIIAKKNNQL